MSFLVREKRHHLLAMSLRMGPATSHWARKLVEANLQSKRLRDETHVDSKQHFTVADGVGDEASMLCVVATTWTQLSCLAGILVPGCGPIWALIRAHSSF
jgi:hypothetical protein